MLTYTSHARRRMEERRISPQVAEVALVMGKVLPGGEHAARYSGEDSSSWWMWNSWW